MDSKWSRARIRQEKIKPPPRERERESERWDRNKPSDPMKPLKNVSSLKM